MAKNLTKEAAALKGWYCLQDLKKLYRLKPAVGQGPTGNVWQGRGWYNVYDKTQCVQMRPYKAATKEQLRVLSIGRELVGTSECQSCGKRVDKWLVRGDMCQVCRDKQRTAKCASVAKSWLDTRTVWADTESTGLDDDAEIVEICLIDSLGRVLMNTLVKPITPIPLEAINIHGIANEDVVNAPSWPQVHEEFCRLIAGKKVVFYGADFDVRLLKQTASKHQLDTPTIDSDCAMHLFAEYWGEERADGGYRWQKLGVAAQQCGIDTQGAHRAAADCIMTLGVVKHIASHQGQ